MSTKAGPGVLDGVTGRMIWRNDPPPDSRYEPIAWSPAEDLIAVSGPSGSVTLLDAANGSVVRTLSHHRGSVDELAWSPDGQFLVSGGGSGGGKEADHGIRIWDTKTNSVVATLEGHTGFVADLAWSPHSATLISASQDNTIRVWDPLNGRLTHTIEVHTDPTRGIAFSPDGQIFASSSWDNTMRFWRTADLRQLGTVRFDRNDHQLYDRVAFSPDGRMLCATRSKAIFLFRVNVPALVAGKRPAPNPCSTRRPSWCSSGTPASGRPGWAGGCRHPEFREHASTHGQQFWVVETLGTTRPDGTECEAVLWDLAGQHVYRPVHVIFLEKVDVALLVFDPTNRQDSLKGVEFWLDQLAGTGRLPPTILVGGRVDRGSSVLSQEELRQFCQRRGIAGGYIGTSAKSGEGIEQLIETVKHVIPWEDATATVTTTTFKRIKDFVLALKEDAASIRCSSTPIGSAGS